MERTERRGPAPVKQAEVTTRSGSMAMLLVQLAIMATAYFVAVVIHRAITTAAGLPVHGMAGDLLEAALVTTVAAGALWVLVLRPLRARTLQAQQLAADREDALRAEAAAQEFRARLHRALEMASTEKAAYQVADRAFGLTVTQHRAELLLADSSEAHLKVAIGRGPDGSPSGCSVGAPHDCPAIRRGQTSSFPSDRELDACPFLQSRDAEPVAAVCVPVNMVGRSIGVLHTAAPASAHPDASTVAQLEVVADQVGARIGMLRVMEQTHLQAATDSLTGLMNRRTVENQVREMMQRGAPFALAMGDLDHFKVLNDTHGHEAGDTALRLFARVVRNTLRSDDLVSRFGGEEFVIAFPGLDVDRAAAALQRVQEQLLVSIAAANISPFTVSFGVAHSGAAASLDELVRLADHALFTAKREGRNRVVLDASSTLPDLEMGSVTPDQ